MTYQPIPSNQYNSLAYFFANTSNTFPPLSKNASRQVLVSIDYTAVASSSPVAAATFSVDIGTAPQLNIAATTFIGEILQFVLSEGVPGVSYILTIITTFADLATHTDTLIVYVPSAGCPCGATEGSATVLNQGDAITGDGAIFINPGIRFFVSSFPPSGPNILDQWFDLTTQKLYEFVSVGTSTEWMELGPSPALISGTITTYMENLVISTLNTFPSLTNTPTPAFGNMMILTIDGQVFLPLGPSPPFSLSGKIITWLSTTYDVPPGSNVNVVYQYQV